jgi:mono/diheme cytochrome c family protein
MAVLAACLAPTLLLAVNPAHLYPQSAPATAQQKGKALFNQNCSICHGVDAKGNGSMYDPESAEESRRVPPADLTSLRAHNGGKFPADRVREAMYSTGLVSAYVAPRMPAWGHVFDNLKADPGRLSASLYNVTAYIESIQAKR